MKSKCERCKDEDTEKCDTCTDPDRDELKIKLAEILKAEHERIGGRIIAKQKRFEIR